VAIFDLARFFDALQRLYPPEARDGVEEMLVAGPGRYEACADLLSLFPQARLTAIDVDEGAIEAIRDTLVEYGDRVRAVVGDVADVSAIAPGPYDLVIVRHPDVARRMEAWQEGIAACVADVRPGGLLVVTCYSLPEASFVDGVMQVLPATLRPGSPYTPAPVALQGNDRYILAYERLENEV
jgi:spermidine synthase